MARRENTDHLVDHLIAAIIPALIMSMVGGLLFFLLDLWYEGPFLARLRWILFWFIFGIVLITRIGMRVGSEQAKGYGFALGGAVALVASTFAGFQPLLLAIMGFVWWATHKLTYDCTLEEQDQDQGRGLLQETGLDPDAEPEDDSSVDETPLDQTDVGQASILLSKREKSQRRSAREEARRPHPPGTWLLHFALASLPLFGLGQWLVPGGGEGKQENLRLYFVAYLGSTLGLLLATSFLNLRRYLGKRRLEMPAPMTAAWLSTGALLVVGLTVASAIWLPSYSGFQPASSHTSHSSSHKSSQWAMLRNSGVQGDGTSSEGEPASKTGRLPQDQQEPKESGKTNDPNAQVQTKEKGRPSAKGKNEQAKSGSAQKSGQSSGSENKSPSQESQGASNNRSADSDEPSSDSSQTSSSSASNPVPPPLPLSAPAWLRIPIQIVLILFLIHGAFRHGPELLKGLMAILNALLQGLWFGGVAKPRAKDQGSGQEEPLVTPPPPFHSFVNPFETGLDQQLSPDDLVLYSFDALESWAFEQDLARLPHETPSEFVRKLRTARSNSPLDATSNRLTAYFVALSYGQLTLNTQILPTLQSFWETLKHPAYR